METEVSQSIRYVGNVLRYYVTTSLRKRYLSERDRQIIFGALLGPKGGAAGLEPNVIRHLETASVFSTMLHTGTRMQSLLKDETNKDLEPNHPGNQVNRFLKWSMIEMTCFGYDENGDIEMIMSGVAPGAKFAAGSDESPVTFNEYMGATGNIDRDFVLFIFAIRLLEGVWPIGTDALLEPNKEGKDLLFKKGIRCYGGVYLELEANNKFANKPVFVKAQRMAAKSKESDIVYEPYLVHDINSDIRRDKIAKDLGWNIPPTPGDFRRSFSISGAKFLPGNKMPKFMKHKSGKKSLHRDVYQSTYGTTSVVSSVCNRATSQNCQKALETTTAIGFLKMQSKANDKESLLPDLLQTELSERCDALLSFLDEFDEADDEEDGDQSNKRAGGEPSLQDADKFNSMVDLLAEAIEWCGYKVEKEEYDGPESLVVIACEILSLDAQIRGSGAQRPVNLMIQAIEGSSTPRIDAIKWILEQRRREMGVIQGRCSGCKQDHLITRDGFKLMNSFTNWRDCVTRDTVLVHCPACSALVDRKEAPKHGSECFKAFFKV